MGSKQEAHPALMIPGPIEFSDEVLESMAHFA
jgi:aspartate aminotransferase-like enzyme